MNLQPDILLGDHYYFRKCEPYEGSARIPFLFQGSAELKFKPGQICNQPVCLEDIMPTLLELGGATFDEGRTRNIQLGRLSIAPIIPEKNRMF